MVDGVMAKADDDPPREEIGGSGRPSSAPVLALLTA